MLKKKTYKNCKFCFQNWKCFFEDELLSFKNRIEIECPDGPFIKDFFNTYINEDPYRYETRWEAPFILWTEVFNHLPITLPGTLARGRRKRARIGGRRGGNSAAVSDLRQRLRAWSGVLFQAGPPTAATPSKSACVLEKITTIRSCQLQEE